MYLKSLKDYVWTKVKVKIEGGSFSDMPVDDLENEHKERMKLSKKKR